MGSVSRGRILLVDPDARALGARVRFLREAGFQVESAPGETDATSLLKREQFDAVLSDASAQNDDASGLIRAIRNLDRDVPVVVMSDAPRIGERSAFEHGVVECLSKSIAPSVLERTLERVVRVCRRWRSLSGYRNWRGEEVEMASFTATGAKNEFGRVLQKATHEGIVVITRHDEPEAVVLSIDEFKDLAGARERKLEALSSEFDALLAKMQTPEARRGVRAAFDASPESMGQAAVEAARKRV